MGHVDHGKQSRSMWNHTTHCIAANQVYGWQDTTVHLSLGMYPPNWAGLLLDNPMDFCKPFVAVWPLYPLFEPGWSVFGLIQAMHMCLTPSNVSPFVSWMATQGWDWNSSSTTITTLWLWLLSHVWWQFPFWAPTFRTKIEWVWTDSDTSHELDPSNLLS